MQSLLEDLVARGLKQGRRYLFVIDGAKALRAAIEKVFGERAEVQRCQVHKRRNVKDHLPENCQKDYENEKAEVVRRIEFSDGRKIRDTS